MTDRKIGTIRRILPNKSRGNIIYFENGEEKSVIFFGIYTKIEGRKTKFIIGDTVEFHISTKMYPDKSFDFAEDLLFIENENLDQLQSFHKSENIYEGFLKKYDNLYYIKEINSYIQVRTNNLTPEFLIPEENFLVKFHLNGREIRKSKATILNLTKNPEFARFREKEIRKAIVKEIDENWIQIKLLDFEFLGRINRKNKEVSYKIGETIFVIYAGIQAQTINFITVL